MSRYGLIRHSYATYRIEGNGRVILIRRNGRRNFLVGDARSPLLPGFFTIKTRTLKAAAEFGRRLVGG